jgi:hypothetical protein
MRSETPGGGSGVARPSRVRLRGVSPCGRWRRAGSSPSSRPARAVAGSPCRPDHVAALPLPFPSAPRPRRAGSRGVGAGEAPGHPRSALVRIEDARRQARSWVPERISTGIMRVDGSGRRNPDGLVHTVGSGRGFSPRPVPGHDGIGPDLAGILDALGFEPPHTEVRSMVRIPGGPQLQYLKGAGLGWRISLSPPDPLPGGQSLAGSRISSSPAHSIEAPLGFGPPFQKLRVT